MRGLSNFNKGESLATGFVRPKVTSLFFDKIWLPNSILDTSFEYTGIPKDLLVKEDNELTISKHFSSIYSGDLYKLSALQNNGKTFNEISAGYIYNELSVYNSPIKINEELITFKYSKNRNNAILLNTENFCRKYKIKISPVFHSLTDFENEVAQLESKHIYGSDSIKFRVKKPNTFKNKDVISICVEDFPDIIDDSLSWEQVLDIKKDKIRNKQLRKFLSWSEQNFQNMSPEKIREILESEMEEYKESLRFFGIKTTTGAFSTIVSSASSIVSILNNPEISLPILSISSVSLSYALNTYMSYLNTKNKPIAYLYDIEHSIY